MKRVLLIAPLLFFVFVNALKIKNSLTAVGSEKKEKIRAAKNQHHRSHKKSKKKHQSELRRLPYPFDQNKAAVAIKEESADEAVNDEFIENMYRKEIEEGDNAEEPLEPTKNTKHRNAKKKHLHGHFGAPFGHGFDSHGLGMDYPISHVHGIHGGIGHPIAHHGYGMHHGHDFHDPIGHPVVVSPGHGHELPIIFPHHDHHRHQHHHPHHMGYYHPEFMPMPYPMPMCVMEKDDKKEDKKDDKKKDDKKEKDKKTKRQLVPCHYYGPPGAGWGSFTPGHTGAGWGAPYWY